MRFIYINYKTKVQENCILRHQKCKQMNVRKYIFATSMIIATLYACSNDDDDEAVRVPPRDRAEQQMNEDPLIQEYLETHFFTLIDNPANPDYQIVQLDTIAGDNSMQTSIWDSGLITEKVITRNDVDYTIYMLKFNEGVVTEQQPTFADSTLVTYRGEQFYENLDEDGDGIPNVADVDADGDGEEDVDKVNNEDVTRVDTDEDGIRDSADVDTMSNEGKPDSDGDGIIDDSDPVDNNNVNRRVFDNRDRPLWLDQISVIDGWREALVDLRGASGFTVPDPNDGTVNYNMDFGNITIFIPSGLAYFDNPPPGTGIGAYKALIFSIQLYGVNEADHDNDGIPSYLEDLDGDRSLIDLDDDTDMDTVPNYFDADDDNDGIPTIDEDLEPDTDLAVDRDGDGDPTNDIGDGDPTNDDSDGDGIPNYLDSDSTASRNDTN